MRRLEKLKKFLQENHPNIQAFNTRNIAGDRMVTVYESSDGITVDYAPGWEYIEIFGITEDEFDSLLDVNYPLFTRLRTFKPGKDYPIEGGKND